MKEIYHSALIVPISVEEAKELVEILNRQIEEAKESIKFRWEFDWINDRASAFLVESGERVLVAEQGAHGVWEAITKPDGVSILNDPDLYDFIRDAEIDMRNAL